MKRYQYIAVAIACTICSSLSFSPAFAQQTVELPGYGDLPQDGQIFTEIAAACGQEPRCIVAAWATEEVSRCRNGVFQAGGCFGPNGEIVRGIRTVWGDITNGPGDHNDIVGKDGFVCTALFGGC